MPSKLFSPLPFLQLALSPSSSMDSTAAAADISLSTDDTAQPASHSPLLADLIVLNYIVYIKERIHLATFGYLSDKKNIHHENWNCLVKEIK